MKRVFLIVLDSVGAGAAPDADKYGDLGASTLEHTINAAKPNLKNLESIGFGYIPNVPCKKPDNAVGAYGRAIERSAGKDTTTGHWEMAGIRLEQAFPTYPNGFPKEVIDAFEKAIGTKTLGNYASSGTVILDELGEEHLKTGYPIVYTSADSVFQLACSEEIAPIEKQYKWCEIARNILQGEHAVGRVIARPFLGKKKGEFKRTSNRKDFSLQPISKTILDVLSKEGCFTMGVGKIEDIFCMQGIQKSIHAAGNPACIDVWMQTMKEDFEGLVFINLVDTDMIYGHRRDVNGYAKSLEEFDKKLGEAMKMAKQDDLFIITADHGCDPTFKGTDHTREYIPIVAWSPKMETLKSIGTRETFADIAATIADVFGVSERFNAKSFKNEII